MTLRLELPDHIMAELVERVATRAAAIVLERLEPRPSQSEFLTVEEAAELLRSERQRVYDLCSDGRLTRYKDGSRVLVSRAEIEAHLAGGSPRRVAHALPTRTGGRIRRRLST